MEFFRYTEIPLNEEDPRYCQSFSVEEAASDAVQDFFEKYGFVVFDVLSQDECSQTIDGIWNHLEQITPTIDRQNQDTWDQGFSHYGWPKDHSSTVVIEPCLLRIRQHPLVVQCFAGILQTNNILSSHDRWLLHRPTKMLNGENRLDWATKPNVHLDLNPAQFVDDNYYKETIHRLDNLSYTSKKNRAFLSENNLVHRKFGRVVQGILTLNDLASDQQGGGTLVIPGSHQWFDEWAKTLKLDKKGDSSHRFGPEMTAVAQRVTMRAGSLVIWDQRLIHGSTTNKSEKMRYGIPIRFFAADQMTSRQSQERSDTLLRLIKENGFEEELTVLGRRVFFGEESEDDSKAIK